MKYIDGIKETDDWNLLRLANHLLKSVKHIPIYEELTEKITIQDCKTLTIIENSGGTTYLVYNTKGKD